MKTFKYITKQGYEKLIKLTGNNSLNSPVRMLYTNTFEKDIEPYRKELDRNQILHDVTIRRIKSDFTVRAILMLMYEKPGLPIGDILNLTIEDVETSEWPPEVVYPLYRLYANYTTFMKELPGSNLKTASSERNGRNCYLFSNSEGNRLTPAAWNAILRKYFKNAGIELDTGGSGSLNYRFRHSFAFKQIIEIEEEHKCNIKNLVGSIAVEKLAEKLKTGTIEKVCSQTCYDYIKFYSENREQIQEELTH